MHAFVLLLCFDHCWSGRSYVHCYTSAAKLVSAWTPVGAFLHFIRQKLSNKNKWQTLGAVTSEKPCISDLFSGVFTEFLCPSICDSFQFNFWCVIIWWRFVFLSLADRVRTKARLIFIHQSNPRALFSIWYVFRHSRILEISAVISIIPAISIDKLISSLQFFTLNQCKRQIAVSNIVP